MGDINQTEFQANASRVREAVAAAARAASRRPEDVRIIPVTKTATAEILPLLQAAGFQDAAENRWQVAREKFTHRAADAFTWHFIGTLQTNKLKYVIPRFHWIHSVDRLALADAINAEAGKQQVVTKVLLQVNIAEEPQKHGWRAEEVLAAAKHVLQLPHVELRGLMTMAPMAADIEETRPIFRALYKLLQEVREALGVDSLNELSMGMSDDFPIAVAEGATMVRIGRRLVGQSLPRERGI